MKQSQNSPVAPPSSSTPTQGLPSLRTSNGHTGGDESRPPPVIFKNRNMPSQQINSDLCNSGSEKSTTLYKSPIPIKTHSNPNFTGVITQQPTKYNRPMTNKQQIFGGSQYSKALLRGENDTVLANLRTLKFLEGVQTLFFQSCKSFPPEIVSFNPKNKCGIWNSSGRVIFYSGMKKVYTCKGCHHSGFIQEVVDYSGKLVLLSQGRQFLFGLTSHVEISLEGDQLVGSMHQTFLSSTYEIKDSTGRVIYKIQAPCFAPCAPFVFWCCKEHFEICMDDGVTEIGKITKHWGSDVDAPEEFRSCLGIELDRVDDVRVKALLLGCFFLIEFQYYRRGGNGPVFFILMLLIFAGILSASECAGYCPFWRKHAIDPVEAI